jgi:hypothetical protein
MPIRHQSSDGIARGHQAFSIGLLGVKPSSTCWATVCELDPTTQTPIYGDAFLTVEQVVPGTDQVSGHVFIDNVPNNIHIRITVYSLDPSEPSPSFTIVSPVLRGRGRERVRMKYDALREHPNVWASVTEIDATGAKSIFGTAFLTVEQIVPDPLNGIVEIGVWIDAVPNDINFQVNLTGL